jgi:hypothetical protein
MGVGVWCVGAMARARDEGTSSPSRRYAGCQPTAYKARVPFSPSSPARAARRLSKTQTLIAALAARTCPDFTQLLPYRVSAACITSLAARAVVIVSVLRVRS